MTWPTRIGMPGGIRTALDESAARWSVDQLARPEVQRRALEDAGRNVAGLRDLLGEVTETVHRSGAVLVAGFPHGSSALVVFAAALGEVNATYNGPAPGRLVHDLVAAAGADYQKADPPHNDSVFIERPHAFIGLLCIRPSGRQDGLTELIRAADVVDALRERGADLEALQDPCFPFAEPEPKDPSAGPPAVHLRPVLSGEGTGATVLWRPTRVRAGLRLRPDALDARHRAALAAFEAVLTEPGLATRVLLGASDLLLLDNRRALHGRTPVAPGGNDRHLKRVKVHA
ncbi:TauD/TfdA family dioxygenase [Kitasatospora sp. NBC_01266]|uniref:TauD/TfdA family dioxygenase n=1 Tax=Kitasatospora sp. NBC_01266 TaxID=2903572 RepID=UPI002E36E5EC|nr:TauD/TfdA family dioxygenase [Kitasatospora sp. NBC_01266]